LVQEAGRACGLLLVEEPPLVEGWATPVARVRPLQPTSPRQQAGQQPRALLLSPPDQRLEGGPTHQEEQQQEEQQEEQQQSQQVQKQAQPVSPPAGWQQQQQVWAAGPEDDAPVPDWLSALSRLEVMQMDWCVSAQQLLEQLRGEPRLDCGQVECWKEQQQWLMAQKEAWELQRCGGHWQGQGQQEHGQGWDAGMGRPQQQPSQQQEPAALATLSGGAGAALVPEPFARHMQPLHAMVGLT